MPVEEAVKYALAQVGKPYVWGTEGPNTFDCSGLVFAAFRHAGYRISRTTFTQIRDGRAVSRGDMARGDLWFTDPGHVAIYLGGEQFVEAPNRNSRVRVVPTRRFFAGRRIDTPSGASGTVPESNGGSGSDIFDLGEGLDRIRDPHTWVRAATVVGGVGLVALLVRNQLVGVVSKAVG